MINIDNGVPLSGNHRTASKYPWAFMEVGDSFLMENVKITNLSNMRAAAERKYNIKLTGRTVTGGVRIWRIA